MINTLIAFYTVAKCIDDQLICIIKEIWMPNIMLYLLKRKKQKIEHGKIYQNIVI